MRTTLRVFGALAALCAVSLVAYAIAPVISALAVPIFTTKGSILAYTMHPLGGLGVAMALAGTTDTITAPGGGVSLASKSRAAQEFRGQANQIRSELLDPSRTFSVDEVKQKMDAANALEVRAAAVAEFTADDEIRRQGADASGGVLTRMDNPDAPRDERLVSRRSRMDARIAEFTERTKAEFGDVRSFLSRSVSGNPWKMNQPLTKGQQAILEENRTLVRAIVGETGDVSGGEFLLPLTQVQSIFSLANVQQGMLQRARAYNVPGRTLRIPVLHQTDEDMPTGTDRPLAGNIANVSIVGEGSTKPVRTPSFIQRLLTVYKYAAVTQASDELLSDDFTGELPEEFINAVGQQALNAVNEDITIDGTGSGEPSGALYPYQAYNISVGRNTAGTIKPEDLFEMYAKHTHGPNSVWLASRRTVQALYAMSLTSASLVTFLRDLNQMPQMMILGYPVILTDLLNPLGTDGDFALVNPDFYAFALRQALTVESSREFAFTQDLTTYRFVVRAGGIPIPTGRYAYKYNTSTSVGIDQHSPFVILTEHDS